MSVRSDGSEPEAAGHPARTLPRTLSSVLEPELLRGTPMHEVMSGFGRHLVSLSAAAKDYDRSMVVPRIDDFLSHDWGTPRFTKLLALTYLYNVEAASIASCLMAWPAAYLGAWLDEKYPDNTDNVLFNGYSPCLAQLLCPIVWLCVLVLWQRLKKPFCPPRYAFLDKLCIHQTDPERKSAGILGLAGFLRSSNRLIVLWSPRYFTRLWCTYELAAWNYLHGSAARPVKFLSGAERPIKVLPTSAPGALLCLSCTIILEGIIVRALLQVVPSWDYYYLMSAIGVVTLVPLNWFLLTMGAEAMAIQKAVERYSMREAQCFCCSHNHIDPISGLPIICDRKLVYSTLGKWCQKRSLIGSSLEHRASVDSTCEKFAVQEFTSFVRKSLLEVLRANTNTSLRFCTYWRVVHATVPVVWRACDLTVSYWYRKQYDRAWRWLVEFSTVSLFVIPVSLAITVQFGIGMSSLTQKIGCGQWIDVFSVLGMGLVLAVTYLALWAPGPYLTEYAITHAEYLGDVPFLGRYVFLANLTFRVMWAGYCCGVDEHVLDDPEAPASESEESVASL
eukprot:TRINITY_DN91940_c0_g1_i1.p1 TRINITY_DN91940_c0_g1~~TRINITY_DN91940_c0_g1_i1.p1  ORF type:complete len:561 (+),score=17.04 TRINITY_DN91940_c0_g1_i1:178-1860(+)